jgi:hypothetical protein
VHSSTSSFRTLPRAWFSIALGAGLALVALVGWELLWRSRGFAPSITDNEPLWCHERRAVGGKDTVVVLGSSRLQVGLDPQVLARALEGRKVISLALGGANPIPALLDLGKDKDFSGVVILEYMPRRMLTPDSAAVARTRGFVESCSNPSLIVDVEAAMDRGLERHLVFLNSELHPVTILSHTVKNRSLPKYSHEILRDDRYSAMHFHGHRRTGTDLDTWEAGLSGQQLDERFASLRGAIEAIESRGGQVILYRSPVADGIMDDEEKRFPAATWLPRVASALHVRVIDFATIPELAKLDPPDGEHLEETDVPGASEAVARAVRGLLATK